jgi:uncharacterized protein YjiS (DUF1127 family)
MNTYFPSPKHKPRFYSTILTIRNVASWVMRISAAWDRSTNRRALQRLGHLNDHALRDIGMWREPESRVDEWWMMNPPP